MTDRHVIHAVEPGFQDRGIGLAFDPGERTFGGGLSSGFAQDDVQLARDLEPGDAEGCVGAIG